MGSGQPFYLMDAVMYFCTISSGIRLAYCLLYSSRNFLLNVFSASVSLTFSGLSESYSSYLPTSNRFDGLPPAVALVLVLSTLPYVYSCSPVEPYFYNASPANPLATAFYVPACIKAYVYQTSIFKYPFPKAPFKLATRSFFFYSDYSFDLLISKFTSALLKFLLYDYFFMII